MNEDLLSTLQAHFHAKFLRARSNLNTYLNNSVGVGEHGDVVGESIQHIEEMEHSRSCVELINQIIESSKTADESSPEG